MPLPWIFMFFLLFFCFFCYLVYFSRAFPSFFSPVSFCSLKPTSSSIPW